jgi:hypothetical protein
MTSRPGRSSDSESRCGGGPARLLTVRCLRRVGAASVVGLGWRTPSPSSPRSRREAAPATVVGDPG